jgi:hypothetical protein
MMNPYEHSEIEHKGRSAHRLASSPRERVFAEEWERQQRSSHTLQWLLCASADQNQQDRELTQEEATCAATLMQWLGSPVGFAWLEDTLMKAKTAELAHAR